MHVICNCFARIHIPTHTHTHLQRNEALQTNSHSPNTFIKVRRCLNRLLSTSFSPFLFPCLISAFQASVTEATELTVRLTTNDKKLKESKVDVTEPKYWCYFHNTQHSCREKLFLELLPNILPKDTKLFVSAGCLVISIRRFLLCEQTENTILPQVKSAARYNYPILPYVPHFSQTIGSPSDNLTCV